MVKVTNNCLEIITENPDSAQSEKRKIIVYPNPAHDFVNIEIVDINFRPTIIKIIDLAGKVIFAHTIGTGIKYLQISVPFRPGNYIITLLSGSFIVYSQKLIISK